MEIRLHKTAAKQLSKAPAYILDKLNLWKDTVVSFGLAYARTIPGYHDEPLEGKRKGQRSIRLNQNWRAIYEETKTGITITILEVTKHDYRTK